VIHNPSHAKSAKVAKKDRFTVASHAFGSTERTLMRSILPRERTNIVCDVDVRRWRISNDVEPERRRQAPTLQRKGGIAATRLAILAFFA
jgi:hypothetical protein